MRVAAALWLYKARVRLCGFASMAHSQLVDKPRAEFLEEMRVYREAKMAYYLELHACERLLLCEVVGELDAIKAGVALPAVAPLAVPLHPICPSRYVTKGI